MGWLVIERQVRGMMEEKLRVQEERERGGRGEDEGSVSSTKAGSGKKKSNSNGTSNGVLFDSAARQARKR